jgi:hypothetical protein
VLARDLQLTPGPHQLTHWPREYLASASQGPPDYSWAPVARNLQITPGPRGENLASACQGPPAYSWAQEYLASSASQGPPAYSRAPGVPS